MRFRDVLDFAITLFGRESRLKPNTRNLPVARQEFAVIGLGRFGSSLAETLVANGHTVLGIDRDPVIVQQLADDLTQTVSLDTTDEDALMEVDIQSYETVVVAIGTHFESSLLTTVALKSLGVRNVICKAATQRHHDILMKVGADRVILPEHEAGSRVAHELSALGILDQISLPGTRRVTEVRLPQRLHGRSVAQAEFEKLHRLHVSALIRDDRLHVCPEPEVVLQDGDLLILIGEEEDIFRFLSP